MSSRRFMIQARTIRNGYASFGGDLFNHMVRVLRLGTGDAVTLVDEKGGEYQGVIDQVDREWVVIKIVETQPKTETGEAGTAITICQALPKGDKTDLVLQKATELGVHDFWLFGGKRSVARMKPEQRTVKLERWNRITSEAARQSRRRLVPQVSWFDTQADALAAASHELRLLLWEGERKQGLKAVLAQQPRPASVIVAVGPEGGFEKAEVERFLEAGFLPVTLGSNILRTETAAIAITAILEFAWNH